MRPSSALNLALQVTSRTTGNQGHCQVCLTKNYLIYHDLKNPVSAPLKNGAEDEGGDLALRHVLLQDDDVAWKENLKIKEKLRCQLTPRRNAKLRRLLCHLLRFGGWAW